MALNASKLPSVNSTNTVKQEAIEAGNCPARVVSILELGLQPQRPYKGEEKPPKVEIRITYELLDEFCVDEKGDELEDKPRWLSEDIPLNPLDSELAKSTKRYLALDPELKFGGDFAQLVGTPCTVLVTTKAGTNKHVGKTFNNVGNVSLMRPKDVAKAAELVNETKVFDLDAPDLEVFLSLPEFLQEKIKGNLNYNGSLLQKALSKAETKGEEPIEEKEPDETTTTEEGADVEW